MNAEQRGLEQNSLYLLCVRTLYLLEHLVKNYLLSTAYICKYALYVWHTAVCLMTNQKSVIFDFMLI